MKIFKPKKPPFKTVEEALVVANQHKANEYLWKEGHCSYEAFCRKYPADEFKNKIQEYSHNAMNLHGILMISFFPVYLGLSSLIWLFDYKSINYQIYLFLRFLHLPMQDPYGWNLSFLLSFIVNFSIFIFIVKSYDFSIIKKVTKFSISFHAIFYYTFITSLAFLFLFSAFIATLPKPSNACTMATLCALHSDSMFLYSSVLLYKFFACFFVMITALIYGLRFGINYINIRTNIL